MSLDRLINLLVTIAVVELMVLTGLKVTFAEIARSAGDWWLLARAALANYLLVPALAVVLLLLFDAAPLVRPDFSSLRSARARRSDRCLRASRAPTCRRRSA
jgi:predicted Na+-dependent transporter